MMGKFILAKGIQEKTGCSILSIKEKFDKEYNSLCDELHVDSFSLENNILWYEKVLAFLCAIYFFVFFQAGDRLLNVHLLGVHIGDLIYDHILRVDGKRYSIDRMRFSDFQFLYQAALWTIVYSRIIKKKNVKYYIAADIVYFNGIIVRIAQKNGAKIILFTANKKFDVVTNKKGMDFYPNYHSYSRDTVCSVFKKGLNERWLEEIDQRLVLLFQGVGDWNTLNAYADKKTVSKSEILRQLGICNNKKNIVILAHCFSDSPHNSGRTLYKDYYEWLEETLKIVQNIHNVNWILKPHPCRHVYGENGQVEILYKKYKNEHLYWMPDEYSAAMIPVLADAVVTVSGTGGIEYSCFGIPSINTGNAFYAELGIGYKIKSIAQYKKTLMHMDKVHRLSEEKILEAKKVYYAYQRVIEINSDSLQAVDNRFYAKYLENRRTCENNNQYIDTLLAWLKENKIQNSYAYQFGWKIS